jgi:selenide,water dikinase
MATHQAYLIRKSKISSIFAQNNMSIKLTGFARGSGCGCKIAPGVLEEIVGGFGRFASDPKLLVGNEARDDAAIYDLGGGNALVSTADFFMPVVDDAFDFGCIAAANALSDVYAMGGKPVLALALLGWPVDKIPAAIAREVMEGARETCAKVGVQLAGGHSIDSMEPMFGLSVNGMVLISNLKKNNTAEEGDLLFITKPIGSGILGNALKKGLLNETEYALLFEIMSSINSEGAMLGGIKGVHSMTDVTGFGLLGHLLEMAEGSGLCAELDYNAVTLAGGVKKYLQQGCLPDQVYKNWNSFEPKVDGIGAESFQTLCDPQTNGGLLVAVSPESADAYLAIAAAGGWPDVASRSIGRMTRKKSVYSVIISAQKA